MCAVQPPVLVFIGLGANLGEQIRTLGCACWQINALPTTHLTAHSSLYRSAPIDAGGPDFTNAVIAVSTRLAPLALLAELQRIEHGSGRQRPYRNAPRTLDLDILRYGELSIDTPTLTIPHPRLSQRAFVLLPLSEIAPQRVSSAMLQAVAAQRIEKVSAEWLALGNAAC